MESRPEDRPEVPLLLDCVDEEASSIAIPIDTDETAEIFRHKDRRNFIAIPIDTAEIFRRLDRQNIDYLNVSLPALENIQRCERAKWVLPISSAVLTLSVAGIGYYLVTYRFLGMTTTTQAFLSSPEPRPDFLGSYLRTPITGLNETCGVRFADINMFQGHYCGRLLSFTDALRRKYLYDNCQFNIPKQPTADYCNWHQIAGYAWDCFNYATQYLDCFKVKYWHLPLRQVVGSDAPDILCREVYVPQPDEHCSFDGSGASSFPPFSLKCGLLAKEICDATLSMLDQFNTSSIPGSNHTCADLYVSDSVYKECEGAALGTLARQKAWDGAQMTFLGDAWWTPERCWQLTMLVLGILLLLTIGGAVGLTSFIRKRNTISEFSDQIDLSETMQHYKPNQDTQKATLSEIVVELQEQTQGVEKDQQFLVQLRMAYLLSLSRLQIVLPKEINQKILHHAGFFKAPPIEVIPAQPRKLTLRPGQGWE